MTTRIFLGTIICMLNISLSALGAVVERDFLNENDGLLTYDVVNRREWLDLSESTGMSVSEILAKMSPGNQLAGFSFAQLVDVEAFATSAGVGWTEPWSLPGNPGSEPYELINLVGYTIEMTGGLLELMQLSLGLIATDTDMPTFDGTNFYITSIGEPPVNIPNINPHLFGPPQHGGMYTSGAFQIPNGPTVGTIESGPFWLYRDVVPEPSTVMLLYVGIAGCLLNRNRS